MFRTHESRLRQTVWLLGLFTFFAPSKSIEAQGTDRPFNPGNQVSLVVQEKGWRVQVTGNETCKGCAGGRSITFVSESRSQRVRKTIALENATAQVDSIHVLNAARFLVIGRALPNTAIVTILELPTGAVVDSFFCFSPALSSNGAKLAYVKVFPAHFTEGVSAQYLSYDFHSSPKLNRKSNVPANDQMNVGIPLFPPGAENRPADNVNVAPASRHSMASDRFYWSSDSSSILFASRSPSRVQIVVADVVNPLKPTVRVAELDLGAVLDSARCAEYKERTEFAVQVRDLVLSANGRQASFRLTSPMRACLQTETMSVLVR